jgi:hypothetical protein
LENEDSDLSTSDDEEETSHFQTGTVTAFQMMQTATVRTTSGFRATQCRHPVQTETQVET